MELSIRAENNIQYYLDELNAKSEFNITQMWLAKKLGVAKQTVNNWCMNLTTPNHCKMIEISVILKVRDVRKLYEIIKEEK